MGVMNLGVGVRCCEKELFDIDMRIKMKLFVGARGWGAGVGGALNFQGRQLFFKWFYFPSENGFTLKGKNAPF